MGLEGLLLHCLLLFSFHSIPCFGNSEGDAASSYHDDASLYTIKAFPTYYGALDGEENTMDQKPFGIITQTTNEVDISASKLVNVESYGAKGDGSDDTKVVHSIISNSILMVKRI